MSVIDATIEVRAPLRATYDQWTQFEDFPRFMQGVEQVHQVQPTRLHWVAKIAGVQREWDAQITEQVPDQLIAWTSTAGVRNDGVVTFEPVDETTTRVGLRLDIEPDGAIETIADVTGAIANRARGDLERFKEFIEEQGAPTGAWRGQVTNGHALGIDQSPGEVEASTGGVVDLDRIIGRIPVVLVFVAPVFDTAIFDTLAGMGRHLVEFGRDRIQLLAVARVDAATAADADISVPGNVRILADADGAIAELYGVTYRDGQPTTVLIGADGEVAEVWVDAAAEGFAGELLDRLEQLDQHLG